MKWYAPNAPTNRVVCWCLVTMSMIPGVGLTANLGSNGYELNPALAMMKATQCFENLAFNSRPQDAEAILISKGLMEKNVTEKGFLEKTGPNLSGLDKTNLLERGYLEKNLIDSSSMFDRETTPLNQPEPTLNPSEDNNSNEEDKDELQSLVSS